MTGINIFNLKDMIDELGEQKVKAMLSEFSCPVNKEVEHFLHHKSIEFAKQGLSQTHLVYMSYKSKLALVGYFTLANKTLIIFKSGVSTTLAKRISKFVKYDEKTKSRLLPAILIAQFSKNYANGMDKLITGEELMKITIDKIFFVQNIIGGKVVYLECEDNEKLIEFYSKHGFRPFGKRPIEADEKYNQEAPYYIQMIRYL